MLNTHFNQGNQFSLPIGVQRTEGHRDSKVNKFCILCVRLKSSKQLPVTCIYLFAVYHIFNLDKNDVLVGTPVHPPSLGADIRKDKKWEML